MWTKLTYPKKCLAMLGSFLLFMLLAYKFSFSDTFSILKEIKEKESKIAWLKQKELEMPVLKEKMASVEGSYSENDTVSVRDKLTAYISDFAENNDCMVTEIPLLNSFKNNNLMVETNSFTVKGNFKDLLRLEHSVENKFRIQARVMSVKYFALKDPQTKRKNLYVTIITQSFNQTNKS